jgi:hypothetical protein
VASRPAEGGRRRRPPAGPALILPVPERLPNRPPTAPWIPPSEPPPAAREEVRERRAAAEERRRRHDEQLKRRYADAMRRTADNERQNLEEARNLRARFPTAGVSDRSAVYRCAAPAASLTS